MNCVNFARGGGTCPFMLSKAVKMGVWWYMLANVRVSSCRIENMWAASAGYSILPSGHGVDVFPTMCN